VILHGSAKNRLFGWGAFGQANASRDQPGGLADLHGRAFVSETPRRPGHIRRHG
jgi:hypothetical protein